MRAVRIRHGGTAGCVVAGRQHGGKPKCICVRHLINPLRLGRRPINIVRGKADVREASRQLQRAEKSGNKWLSSSFNRTMTTATLTGRAIALSSGPVPTMLAAVTDTMRMALDHLKTTVMAGRAVAMTGIVAVSIRKQYDLKLNPRLRA